jgi:hypothetical protein
MPTVKKFKARRAISSEKETQPVIGSSKSLNWHVEDISQNAELFIVSIQQDTDAKDVNKTHYCVMKLSS